VITIKKLNKKFGDNHVLHDVDEHITKGEKVVIIGPSGSGKSTFLRSLNLLEIPTSGEIWFEKLLSLKRSWFSRFGENVCVQEAESE
jgi:polar amino acid transport system ATP-binding protein